MTLVGRYASKEIKVSGGSGSYSYKILSGKDCISIFDNNVVNPFKVGKATVQVTDKKTKKTTKFNVTVKDASFKKIKSLIVDLPGAISWEDVFDGMPYNYDPLEIYEINAKDDILFIGSATTEPVAYKEGTTKLKLKYNGKKKTITVHVKMQNSITVKCKSDLDDAKIKITITNNSKKSITILKNKTKIGYTLGGGDYFYTLPNNSMIGKNVTIKPGKTGTITIQGNNEFYKEIHESIYGGECDVDLSVEDIKELVEEGAVYLAIQNEKKSYEAYVYIYGNGKYNISY